MGGNIAWTIRKADGTEFRMDRWTNIISDSINDDFLEGKEEAFNEAMESWLSMKDDWEKNGPKGPFEHPMTDVYAPYPYGLMPSEYGFIVTDFVTKTLISCNSYTSFNHIWAMAFWWRDEEELEQYGDRIARYQKMFTEGRILNLWTFDRGRHPSLLKVELPPATAFKNLVEKSVALANDSVVNFDVAPPAGWTFLEFSVNKSRKEAFEAVKALGFALTQKEEKAWQKWLKEF